MNSREEEASVLREAFEKAMPVSFGVPIGMLVLRWMYGLSYSIPIEVYVFVAVLGVIYFLISRPPLRLKITRFSYYAIMGFLLPVGMLPTAVMLMKMTEGKADRITWQEPLIGCGAFALLIALTRRPSRNRRSEDQGDAGNPGC